ncbi:hypothetical protein [Natrinema salifodinae]|uniref:Uncharacterized protein n=1 Tax=Natrinema salifodinae TaxID=1202768 RepID=A0A1I0MG74_9EURY|nr:hypothetical protein [Natrinema salifodinae]SEV87397.1 hypothetical protein SAMN05216285_0936 [Natrinema salifodinae]
MAESEERAKSAAVCENCDEIVTVWIWPDGDIQPIGDSNPCSCVDPEFRILNADPRST